MMTPQLRTVALATGVALAVSTLWLVRHKYRGQQQLFFPKHEPVRLPASSSGLPGASDVQFDADGVAIRGWYVPSKNHATVILTHGAGANRSSLVLEARALIEKDFGTLLFDWPGHGESGGDIHWNEGERAALRAAIDWLSARSGVAPERLGAFGFSMGGYVVSQVAAEDKRLEAVVLAGTPANQREQIHFQHGGLWLLGELPALYALRQGGMEIDRERPIDVVAKIAPRAVMLIGGTRDVIVPPAMAPQLFATAREPKELLMVEGAGHGDYASPPGSPYLSRLCAFFERTLIGLSR
jgi:alpha-beta hydrolase superfamily lysophospholipase